MDSTIQLHERIGLTGASSFLTTLVLNRLATLSSVKEVHIFDVKPPAIASTKFIFHRVDLTKDEASSNISSVLIENKITTFIHGALFSGPTRKKSYHHEVETIGTYHVLNALAEAQISKLIVHSATFVYGAHPKNPNFINESFELRMQGPHFVRTRIDVENQIQDFANNYPNCAVTVLRFAPILGPNSTNIRARYFFAGIVPKVLGYDPLVQFIHEDDAVRAQIMALSSSASGVFNIVGRGVLPLTTGVHMSGKLPVPFIAPMCHTFFAAGYASRIWELPSDIVPFFQYICVADSKRAEDILGFMPKYSSRQALKSMIEANRLRKIGFSIPSSTLGEDAAYASSQGFQRIF
ncbi:MAG: NAD-dependent epimerase/dehydratase family protein [Spirobacillus cienkowskii]|jgi:UDP-glucose 4-epimerase|uniref:NAD-dependent epimerase/dehydratase family protein n=1 Tax=Spirobacillus cienkowskii TaxID=495820 RepID=A0A369KRI2_9BACT|nr:MAG: NAD-dependent epimerase/dehydratase family protein [Spirobacillus cienkowskii]